MEGDSGFCLLLYCHHSMDRVAVFFAFASYLASLLLLTRLFQRWWRWLWRMYVSHDVLCPGRGYNNFDSLATFYMGESDICYRSKSSASFLRKQLLRKKIKVKRKSETPMPQSKKKRKKGILLVRATNFLQAGLLELVDETIRTRIVPRHGILAIQLRADLLCFPQ